MLRGYRAAKLRLRYRGLTMEQIFSKIYSTNAWGGDKGDFYSGSGSDEAWTAKYREYVSDFIRQKNIKSIVDLGCGDFRVGSKLPGEVIGVDLVPALIERNRRVYPDHTFHCLNMIDQDLPAADLCLIRQVFQHLSNAQIQKVLAKLGSYRYVLVTEHQAVPCSAPNVDKLPGPDIRLGSGVFLSEPPFSQKCTEVLSVPLAENETLQTVLIEN